MMLTDGDVVKITTKSTYQSEDMFNVFWYVIDVLVAGVTLLDLLIEFRDRVITEVLESQIATVTYDSVIADNMTNEVDTESLSLSNIGGDASGGTPSASFNSLGYQLTVGSKVTGPGGKRFGGIGEDRINGNIQSVPGATVDSIGAILITVLDPFGTPSGQADMTPSIVKRSTLGLGAGIITQPITGYIVSPNIRSQVSRRASA